MKATLPKPEHYSYQTHRKQVMLQVILPVVLTAVLVIAMIILVSLATFRGGDVARWAEISTIWIVVPIMLAGVIFLTLLIGLIYLIARLLGILPTYTSMAQDYIYMARRYILRAADLAAKPIIAIDAFLANIKAFLGRI